MPGTRVTIKDLAKRMNLSVSTISRALHNHPSIGAETTKEVWQLAKQLGYFPNSVASNLRRRKTNMIGVIVPRIDITFHSYVISGVEEVAYKLGYNVTIYQSRDSLEREIAITSILQTNMVAGIIACLALETQNCNHFSRFNSLRVPLVFYDRVSNDLEASKVIIDDFDAASRVTQHLIDTGCRKIAHIAGCQTTSIFASRLEGYKAALLRNNLVFDPAMVYCTTNLTYEEGAKGARKLLKLPELPDGIFCANDYTAIGAIQAIKKANLRIPDDIAVAGFSNYPVSTIIEPALTTIDDRAFEMGKTAARMLIRQIEERDANIASETIVLKTDLIIRESTRREPVRP
ncbi:MAG: LacI family DNA-binding transcriptional regulator [Bacteroidales bacterium]|jgi:LacI family transcriptional regulator|nr:LacI family DNA-binding transcriptional regulator [Bacteroidales bacterium]